MKKVGILTFQFPENRNFGASLQSYACMKLIEKFNNEVEIINYYKDNFNETIKKYILSNIEGKNFKEYNKKFLKLTNKINSSNELEDLNNQFDIFVVGSDQVWRNTCLNNKTTHYFFDFVEENKKKISYAASFGIDYWEGDRQVTEEVKSLIKRFNQISVREESGIDICRNVFGIENVVCVLDPTLTIDRGDYQPILDDWKDKSHLKKKYIAHMLLDDTEQLKKGSKKVADYLGLKINYIKGKTINILGKPLILYNKVSQWLTYLKDAELVITDSFHCTVFSIIFHKKFVVVVNSSRGIARLETLLGKLGLQDRLFTNIDDVLKSGILDKEIDYEEVDKKLEIHRKYSMEFLKKALED